ncbi:response regulator [Psychroflexus lacisalsi]|jgi:two-component system nitrate/nitrite response regulator NarL|uniref:Response regulator transcription factor n=1 Tax=Psychroflexus lacisalsi TaxID=503928 RepID=A0ABP3VRL4_9FLAO|nr:response regulator transcription factor [Psychroflexus lacisalsi]MBZ9620279.1 response regulator transcription factor [Psychroflexus lacisalsi]
MIKVAIADDHQTLIDGICLRLENDKNIDLKFFTNNGRDFLKKLKNTPVDIAIIDIKMPKMDGVSLTRVLRAEHSDIKIIVLSMFDQIDAVRKMIDAKVNGYVLKTSPMDELVIALREVYEGNDYFDDHLEGISELFNKREKSEKSKLSQTEKEILDLIAEGKTSQEIAEVRQSAVSTIDTHRRNMSHKLGLYGKGELLRYAMDKKYKFD